MTADQRREERRNKFLDAGLDILRNDGLAKVTVVGVCAKAGVTDRYFYESFDSRDVLLDALFDKLAADAAGKNATIDELTAGGFGRIADVQAGEVLMRHRSALTRALAEQTAQFAHMILGQGAFNTAQARTAIRFSLGGAVETVTGWIDGTLDTTREQVVETCTDLLMAAGTVQLAKLHPTSS
ncbi:TetR/AcrR family transcriptional regulator [Mycolicibacterium sp. CBMA 361]|uniref:TetR/AcrR family transcriptional regulator n=1 Tax=Mycolicibacterium sp. CBMA 361 TaxID=2606610 RepID=UPI001396C877|nr:TetR/AcrR family transcriptional regulator [Mycolicibacterium sp. CBMA 361]